MRIQIDTPLGPIVGVQNENHQSFLGIPFAKPPLGELRFRAPERPDARSGVLDAASGYRPAAPQGQSPLPGMSVEKTAEDCLYLNVFTPKADGGAKPVLFWIHGGGFTAGSASQALYDGAPLVTRGDVVVVTINYRLGALGYLSLDGVDANIGQRDQIAALQWVRDNIAAFGGDPENVTIFGESAGGMAVTALLAMPAARGLFHRAISQSGTTHQGYGTDSADTVAAMLLEELAVSDVARLRSAPVESLVKAQLSCMAKARGLMQMPFVPIIDPQSMPTHPLAAVAAGDAREIPLMVGTNLDEFKLFTLGNRKMAAMGNESLQKRARSWVASCGRDELAAKELVETYRVALEKRGANSPYEILSAIESDRSFRVPGIRITEAQANHQPQTFAYLFSWKSPAARGLLGACHALELPFVFGTLGAPTMDRFAGTGPDADRLSETMMDAWLAFARSGDPSCDTLPNWDGYETNRRATMTFDRSCKLIDAPYDTERAAWDRIL